MNYQTNSANQNLNPPFLGDTILLIAALIVAIFSLVMIYSTTAVVAAEKFADPFFYLKRQGIAFIIGIGSLIFLSNVSVTKLKKMAPYCLLLAVLLVVLTFVPGLGRSSGGARRWLNLPFISFQPAEVAKILYVIFLAGFLSRRVDKLKHFTYSVLIPIIFLVILAALLLKQPDFGSSAIITAITLAMILVSGVRLRHLLYTSLPLILTGAYLIKTSSYRMRRILAFLNPEEDLQGRGYQLSQSLIAVSGGGWDGVGLGDSMQKLHFLPAAHTDFLFAVVAEELGLLGCLVIICCFLIILWRGFAIAQQLLPDMFTFSLAVGLTLLLVIPALFNIGVVTGVLPTKGLVLPLLGYGGSSMIASLSIIGLLIALAKHNYRHAV